MRGIRFGILSLGALTLAACSGPTAVEQDGVRVDAEEESIEVENHRSTSIFISVIGRDVAPLVLLASCPDTGACPRVEANSQREFDRGELDLLETESEEAILHWWDVVPAEGGGFEPTEHHSIVFPLQ